MFLVWIISLLQQDNNDLYTGKVHHYFHQTDKNKHKQDGKDDASNDKMVKFTLLKITFPIGFCLHTEAGSDDAFHHA